MRLKSEDKVVDKITTPGKDELVLKNGTYLGEVLYELPAGIVNKTETGIGATTLELDSERNSIIVEPLRVIAYSKAAKDPKRLYVGSKIGSSTTTKKEIQEYVNDPSILYKKIIVVADSLPKVIEAIGPQVYKDYFLMIDEGDSFQMESTFRDSMEKCLDYYKRFPRNNRSFVSATPLEFSDPFLKDEHQFIVRYEKPNSRKIRLVHSNNVLGTAVEKIRQLIDRNPAEKIAVAYNSVQGCVDLANLIVHSGHVDESDVKILCSPNNKDTAGIYYDILNREELPGQLNFLTSAYFTGLDIKEQFHLVSVSNPELVYSILSDHRLKQIAGRCRHADGLFSEIVIHGTVEKGDSELSSIEELLAAAHNEIKSLECLRLHYKDNPILSKELEKIRNMILDNTGYNGYRLVRDNILTKEATVSYFNIDAALENQRVRAEVYTRPENLKQLLEAESHFVTFEQYNSVLKVGKSVGAMANEKEISRVLKELEGVKTKIEIENLASIFTSGIEKQVIKEFGNYYGYIETAELLLILRKAFKGDRKALGQLEGVFNFEMLSITNPFKKSIFRNFPEGSVFTSEEILQGLKDSAREASFDLSHIKSVKAAVEYLGRIITLSARSRKRGKKSKEKTASIYSVVNHQPSKVKFIRKIPGVDGFRAEDFIE